MRIDRGLLNWGVFLIALGGVPLVVQQGWVDSSIASDLWRLWPLILVGVGLGLILRWTPFAWLGGALVAATFGLVFGALMAGGISGISSACVGISGGESSISEDRGPASGSAFEMRLTLSCGELSVAREAGTAWTVRTVHDPDDPPTITASESGLGIRQGGSGGDIFVLTQQARNEWQVGLPATAAIEAYLTLNAAEATIDLERGPLRSIDGTFNAADVFLGLSETSTPQPASLSLRFNASSGTLSLPDGSLAGRLTLNASSLAICVPSSAEMRIKLDATLASDDLGSAALNRVGDGWQTAGYDAAPARIDLSISSTVSSISLERAEVCP